MNDCPNAMQQEHISLLATLVEKVDCHDKKIDDFSIMKDTLVELKMLSKEQSGYNKKFNEMYEKSLLSNAEFSNTLININENLHALNIEMKGTNERIDHVEIQMKEIDNKSKIDIVELAKQYAVPSLLGGGIIYFIIKVVEQSIK